MNFWDVHGLWFILFLFLFPRLTMLVTGIFATFMGFWFFLGWIFVPRIVIAVLATTYYWDTNAFLCFLTWFWAITGTGVSSSATSSMAKNHR